MVADVHAAGEWVGLRMASAAEAIGDSLTALNPFERAGNF
jgi:hypothetical protein